MKYCKEVLIRLKDRNEPNQEISTQHITGCDRLHVYIWGPFLVIDAHNPGGAHLSQINLDLSCIREYALKGIFIEESQTYGHSGQGGCDS